MEARLQRGGELQAAVGRAVMLASSQQLAGALLHAGGATAPVACRWESTSPLNPRKGATCSSKA